jgi:hypothetical protein
MIPGWQFGYFPVCTARCGFSCIVSFRHTNHTALRLATEAIVIVAAYALSFARSFTHSIFCLLDNLSCSLEFTYVIMDGTGCDGVMGTVHISQVAFRGNGMGALKYRDSKLLS